MAAADDVRRYWDGKAEALRTDPAATMKDVLLRQLEIEAIGSRLRTDDELLDVGTGNAFGAVRWAARCRRVVAVDYSDRMVDVAREAVRASGRLNVEVQSADVLDLAPHAGAFTAVSCVRCLINLGSESDQMRALDEMVHALRPGGRLFLIEGLEDTFAAMNALRAQSGLPAIPLNWHNRLLRREALETALGTKMRIRERVDFGEYYFISRIVHPLVTAPAEPSFQGRTNEVAADLWRRGAARSRFADISTLMLYVCERP
jgi:ubiquinone/menaquinone biosynthesis C-methylase UbiE